MIAGNVWTRVTTNYEVEKENQSLLKLNVLVEAKGLLLCASSQNLELGFTVKFTRYNSDVTFEDGETEKDCYHPNDWLYRTSRNSIFDFKAKLTSVSDSALLGFATDATIQVMAGANQSQTSYDDQASQLDYTVTKLAPWNQFRR